MKKIKTEEDQVAQRIPTQMLVKNQNKEVWITPSKSKEEIFERRSNQYKNNDNQGKSYHFDKLFNETSNNTIHPILNENDFDVVTVDNLGFVCKICNTQKPGIMNF